MDNPRAEKVAVVNEVKDRLDAADGTLLTEYRGLTVAELADLRGQLAAAGGDYKVYKNTLVRLAVADGPQAPIQDLLTGPTAIAFVKGDVSAVAKALRDFARANPNLVVKGGMVGTGLLSASDIEVLADLPSRDTLLAQFAGALSAPAPAVGRTGPGPAPQPGLRDLGPDRAAPGRRRGVGGPGRGRRRVDRDRVGARGPARGHGGRPGPRGRIDRGGSGRRCRGRSPGRRLEAETPAADAPAETAETE